jgi:putative transposase
VVYEYIDHGHPRSPTRASARESNMHWRDRHMRRPAINQPGDAHELTFSCYHGYPFLKAERTCQWLADAINKARARFDFHLWAYVFMPEHVHVVVYPRMPNYDMDVILKSIKQTVGQKAVRYLRQHDHEWLRRITVKRGKRVDRYFWQPGGGFDRNETEPKAILAMIEYIHANPVRRGLVARPEDWRWSSAGWIEGKNSLRPDPIDFGGDTLFTGGRE